MTAPLHMSNPLPAPETCHICGKPAACRSLEPPEAEGDGDTFACDHCCDHVDGPYGRCEPFITDPVGKDTGASLNSPIPAPCSECLRLGRLSEVDGLYKTYELQRTAQTLPCGTCAGSGVAPLPASTNAFEGRKESLRRSVEKDLGERTQHIAAFCEQTAADGIMPSPAWFSETAATLRDALTAAPAVSPSPCEWTVTEEDSIGGFLTPGCRPNSGFHRRRVEKFKVCPYCAKAIQISELDDV